MSNPKYIKEIACESVNSGSFCQNENKIHNVSIQIFANGVEIIKETCEGKDVMYMEDFTWDSFRLLIDEIES